MTRNRLFALSLAAGSLALGLGLAAADPPQKRSRRPPPEAIAACEQKSAGDSCTVKLPDDRTLDGVCRPPPEGKEGPLACVPDGPPPEPPR
jgi:hypothetical protein